MPVVEIEITVNATRERCFDLARDIDLHVRSMASSREKAVAGRTSGLIGPGEQVTWEARHFGVVQRFTSRITEFRRPEYFQDSMIKGAFRSFVHDHYFEEDAKGGTVMREVVAFRSPLGVLGWIVDRMIMKGYLARLLADRQEVVKVAAEGDTRTGPTATLAPSHRIRP